MLSCGEYLWSSEVNTAVRGGEWPSCGLQSSSQSDSSALGPQRRTASQKTHSCALSTSFCPSSSFPTPAPQDQALSQLGPPWFLPEAAHAEQLELAMLDGSGGVNCPVSCQGECLSHSGPGIRIVLWKPESCSGLLRLFAPSRRLHLADPVGGFQGPELT